MGYLSEKAARLTPYAAGIQPRGGGWIKLNTNENPYPPSPMAAEAIHGADPAALRLYPDGDAQGLCRAVAERLGLSPGNVFCGNGSDEVLALAFQAFYSGRRGVLMPDITYSFYSVWCEMYDVGARLVPVGEDFSIDPGGYIGGSGAVIANPNAPTGLALPLDSVAAIARNSPSGVVIIDEAYIDFASVESAARLIGEHDNILVTRTFSKAYSLAGLRVGFALGAEGLIAALRKMKDAFNSYPLGALAQAAAAAAVLDEGYFAENIARITATRDSTARRLRELGYGTADSQANFLFVRAKDAGALYEHLLGNKILVRRWDKPRISDYLRVTVGTDAEMEAFIECVRRF